MAFTFKFPPEVRQRLQAIKRDIQAEQQQLSEAVGVSLLSNSQQAYLTKSKGGTGSDGVKWAPLAPSTIAKRNRRGRANAKRTKTKSGKARPIGGGVDIGRDTGLQLSSARPGKSGNIFDAKPGSITVGYGMSYSKYFDEDRALMPNRLPASWRKSCEAVVNRWLDSVFNRRLAD